jgi:hypothetical protein
MRAEDYLRSKEGIEACCEASPVRGCTRSNIVTSSTPFQTYATSFFQPTQNHQWVISQEWVTGVTGSRFFHMGHCSGEAESYDLSCWALGGSKRAEFDGDGSVNAYNVVPQFVGEVCL